MYSRGVIVPRMYIHFLPLPTNTLLIIIGWSKTVIERYSIGVSVCVQNNEWK
jgi:hypothetical protein